MLTNVWAPGDFQPPTDAVYIYTETAEERTKHVQAWGGRGSGLRILSVDATDRDTCLVKTGGGETRSLTLRDLNGIRQFLAELSAPVIYFDITGMPHHAWAPLVRASVGLSVELRALYAEPRDYRYSRDATEDNIFDLSTRIMGIAPMPGFTVLREPEQDNLYLVPLVGFEGGRLLNIINEIDPPSGRVFPIVGLPGFRPEYVFHAMQGNRAALERGGAWKQVRFASADCPFSAYYEIERIFEDSPRRYLKLAPIGTRPHALGAVAFAIQHFDQCELVYDHPLEAAGRSEGIGSLHEYNLTALLQLA